MTRPLRILTFSTLYPSSARPEHGIFIETRLRKVIETGRVESRVLAPVPWFPSTHPWFGAYARSARTPKRELLNGIEVTHPRYALLPKIGMHLAPGALFRSAAREVERIIASGFDFDLIDAHYFYPDGVAAAALARRFNKRLLITARGSDITQLPDYAGPRARIIEAAHAADGCVGVCQDLMTRLEAFGIPPEKTHVIRNGVDLDRFTPQDRLASRKEIGVPADVKVFVSVGHLIERKGHDRVIDMLQHFDTAHAVIVGDGPLRKNLQSKAEQLGLGARVHFAGVQPQGLLKTYFSAADVMVLASSREGWANVLLESMACGTPVIATPVNGTPEVISHPDAGRLSRSRQLEDLVLAARDLLNEYPDRGDVRRFAEQFSWTESVRKQIELYEHVLDLRSVQAA